MGRLTNRNKEIPLPCPENALFWGRVHEKLARYEDLEEQAKPKTLCEKWPSFCCSCIIENCAEIAFVVGGERMMTIEVPALVMELNRRLNKAEEGE